MAPRVLQFVHQILSRVAFRSQFTVIYVFYLRCSLKETIFHIHDGVHSDPGSSGSIVSGYGLDDWAIGVRSPAGTKDYSSGLWGPPSLLSNGYLRSFPRG
jgi:hypothetical protein